MISVDLKYLRIMNLPGFHQQDTFQFNFPCPICGDSKTNKSKKRCYAIKDKNKDGMYYYCHNCNFAGSFGFFLKQVNPNLFTDWRKEKAMWKLGGEEQYETKQLAKQNNEGVKTIEPPKKFKILGDADRVVNLDENHKAVQYLKNRKIPEKLYGDIYYCANYRIWINQNYVVKYHRVCMKDERIVFPIYNQKGELAGFQGRTIDNDEARYLTVKLGEERLIYGIDKVNKTAKDIFVTEGIFDAIFLPNSIAMLSSDVGRDFLNEQFPARNLVFVYDNEPRNANIVHKMKKIAKDPDYGLFFWRIKDLKAKDINDLVVYHNFTTEQILELVKKNTAYDPMQKQIMLDFWQKS